MTDNITVQVKSPSLQEALEIQIVRDASITILKQEIQRVHPQHPVPANQRIIHSGKLLDNDNLIEALLKKTEENVVPTFHLVVKPSNNSSSSRQPVDSYYNNNTSIQPNQPNQPNITTTTATITTIPETQGQSEPQIQQPQSTQTYSQAQPQVGMTNNLPAYPPLLPGGYQVIALNGQYYLAPVLVPSVHPMPVQTQPINQQQYVPTYNHEYIPEIGHRYTHQDVHQNVQQPQVQQQQQQQQQQQFQPQFQPQAQVQPQQQQQQQQQQQRQLQPQAIVRNIAGFFRPANGQLAGNIWLALKLYFMIFVLSQGASLERIILFHALALVLFLYQTGRLRVVVHRARRPQTVPTTTFEVIKRGIYMFFLSFWPSFTQDQQHAE